MAYPAAAIANEFFWLAEQGAEPLTQMQVQKLVYFAHGWNLAITGEPLINERVEAWEYGPVVKSLYKDLREYGSGPIGRPLVEPDWESLNSLITPTIDDGPDPDTNDFTKALVQKIWDTYGRFKAFQLSEMTHVPDSPWSEARNTGMQFIPDDRIRKYFESLKDQSSETAEPQAR